MVIHESINIFGGFAPFPNTIMIPTMGLQSDVIGFRFGFGYEKGKRTLRAMSNAQFNALTPEEELNIYQRHDMAAITYFQQELATWVALQHDIIEKSVEIEKMKAQRTPSAMAEIIQTMNTAVSEQGATVTWENLAETWNNFFGGGQIFNNTFNTGTMSGGSGRDGRDPRQPGGDDPHTPDEPKEPEEPKVQTQHFKDWTKTKSALNNWIISEKSWKDLGSNPPGGAHSGSTAYQQWAHARLVTRSVADQRKVIFVNLRNEYSSTYNQHFEEAVAPPEFE